MSKEFVSNIFEPFEREKSSTISGIQGTGLGMAITKNIVDIMNGTIEVKSQQGVGTEVNVWFTFRLDPELKRPKDIPKLKNCRALVVDDDFNTCDSVTDMLGQIGMRAMTFFNTVICFFLSAVHNRIQAVPQFRGKQRLTAKSCNSGLLCLFLDLQPVIRRQKDDRHILPHFLAV
mgnify:CR=1 FL=1